MENNRSSFKKPFNSSFIVRNTMSNKAVKVFNHKIGPGNSRDLMQIPYIYEQDIKMSLTNGELYFKLMTGELTVVSTNVDLFIQDETFVAFLVENGLSEDSLNKIRNLNLNGTVKAGKIVSLSEVAITTNATPTIISSFECDTNSLYDVFAIFLGEKQDKTQKIRFKRSAGFNVSNGSLTQIEDTATVGTDLIFGGASWTVTIAPSSGNIVMSVTGASSTTINWSLECTIIKSSN